MRLSLHGFSATVFVLALVGCGGQGPMPDGMPELHPVTLSIIQGGSPLVGASVQLVPADPSGNKWVSGGNTDENGQVAIRTHGKYVGAPAGTYKVTISKTATEGTAGDPNDPGATSTLKSFSVVDKSFGSDTTTPAEIEVVPGSNDLDPIDVGAAIREEVEAL